ncbi:SdpI family protein [Paeniglutamicibacter sp. MACA_103]|uniref:SdpI family protein n=1 Tax=Paeniglutamicibacter sp. MACA_103 TaxID=3377337 RepID=UPI003895AC7E
MDGETLTELIMTVVLVLLMAAMAWMMKAAATGQIKRNPWIGIRTAALMHCDDCWLLGHHAAANKGVMGCWLAALLMAASGIVSVLATLPEFVHPAALLASLAVMLGGLFLGLRDANRAVAKIHAGEGIVSS